MFLYKQMLEVIVYEMNKKVDVDLIRYLRLIIFVEI